MCDLVKIVFNPMDRGIEVKQGTILLDVIRQAGINIRNRCARRIRDKKACRKLRTW